MRRQKGEMIVGESRLFGETTHSLFTSGVQRELEPPFMACQGVGGEQAIVPQRI